MKRIGTVKQTLVCLAKVFGEDSTHSGSLARFWDAAPRANSQDSRAPAVSS